ncbi:hypothetical protein GSI_14798 [Ganoderma sinense ZZ0214-1]|uniref:F-box domain-containing protein n=1 Tax=Ganoderma sinense ZZ0214-1 TaxID=1077348 RepID=A0A2G8RPQ6_9APHY|nr:hypothetical protein GSI_14798 [Ganoderma sinense ZZ0214-1]
MTTLNVDVLATVCEFLIDLPDILSIALTCSSLRPVADRWLLSSRTINLETKESIRKFHSFLFASPHSRTPHVRAVGLTLDLSHSRPSSGLPEQMDGDFSLLIDILTSCPRLEHIKLFCGNLSSEGKLEDSLVVVNTIVAIPSLRSIHVSGMTKEVVTVLREVRAPLQMVGLYCVNDPGDYWYPAALQNALNLTRIAPTLENLELSFFTVDEEENQAVFNTSTPSILNMAQYPAVRSLAVQCLVRQPRLDRLQHLFPALDDTLSLGKVYWLHEDSYARVRAENLRAQRDAPSRSWKKLDRVRMDDAPMFYILGLMCPIRMISLEYPKYTKLHYARDALRENPVPQLRLSLMFRPQTRMLDDLLSPELARTLTHLMLCLVCSNGTGQRQEEAFVQLQWDEFLGEILSAVQHLHKLTHLRIVVYAAISLGTPWSGPYSEGLIDAMRGSAFDFKGTAAALARPLPSLQFLALTMSGCLTCHDPSDSDREVHERWNVTEAWRVAARPSTGVAQDSEPVLVARSLRRS